MTVTSSRRPCFINHEIIRYLVPAESLRSIFLCISKHLRLILINLCKRKARTTVRAEENRRLNLKIGVDRVAPTS